MSEQSTEIRRVRTSEELERLYPEACLGLTVPIRCENGCGVIISCLDGFRSYQKDENGNPLLICQCCAAEIGHLDEENEGPEDAPVCKRKPKVEGKQ